jgi:RNA polymerase sigma-70 factor (ECF subfamily)
LDEISSGLSLEDLHEVKEVGRLITEYVKQLNERQRYIFIDRYYFAEPIEKTAAELSISVRTAYREVDRIKLGLKEYLQRNGVQV